MGPSLVKAKDLLAKSEAINRKLQALIEVDRRTTTLREDLAREPLDDLNVLRQSLSGELDGVREMLEQGDEEAGSRMVRSYEKRMSALLPYASRLHLLKGSMERSSPGPLTAYGKGRPMLEGIEKLLAKRDLPGAAMGMDSLEEMMSGAPVGGDDRRNADKDRGLVPDDIPRCRFCQNPVPNLSTVCPYCGFNPKADTKDCPNCHSAVLSMFEFCPHCSTKLSAAGR